MSEQVYTEALQEWIGPRRIISPDQFGPIENGFIEDAVRRLEMIQPEMFHWQEASHRPGLLVGKPDEANPDCAELTVSRAWVLYCSAAERIVALRTVGIPYVPPEFRGNGYGAELTLAWLSTYRRMLPSHYSTDGFHMHCAVHRLAVERADPADVPAHVREQYVLQDGRLQLRERWTPEDHMNQRPRYAAIFARERALEREDDSAPIPFDF